MTSTIEINKAVAKKKDWNLKHQCDEDEKDFCKRMIAIFGEKNIPEGTRLEVTTEEIDRIVYLLERIVKFGLEEYC